jgi:hypothetical protein
MGNAFMAAAVVALVLIAAVVVTVLATPGAFGFGGQPEQSAPSANGRVTAVNVAIDPPKKHALQPIRVPKAPPPVAPARVSTPTAPPVVVQAAPAPVAVSGTRQRPAAKPHAAPDSHPVVEARGGHTRPPATPVTKSDGSDGTD